MDGSASYSAYLAWFIFLISELVAYSIIKSIASFGQVIWETEEISKPQWSNHALIMVVSLIVINGHGMMVFRLFPSCRTVLIKCIHAFIHTAILIASIYAYYLIHNFKNNLNLSHFSFRKFHTSFGVMTAILYIFQWIAAMFVYLYLYSNQRRRKLFASCHNFLGVCVLQISIATACFQLQEMNYKKNIFEEQHAENAMVLMVIYGVLVNIIVLNPYLEWRLVGPL